MQKTRREVEDRLTGMAAWQIPTKCVECLIKNGEDKSCWFGFNPACTVCLVPPFTPCPHCDRLPTPEEEAARSQL